MFLRKSFQRTAVFKVMVFAGKSSCLAFLLVVVLLSPLQAHIGKPIKLAAVFSLTGIAASHNSEMVRMTEMAVAEINSRGGIGKRPVELTLLDNESTSIGSAIAAKKAVAMNAVAVIGSVWSSHSLAMAPILEKAGIPMISPASTNPDVTKGRDYIFRVCFIDSFQGLAMAEFAREELGVTTAAVVSNLDEEYSAQLARFFKERFVEAGGVLVMDAQYRRDAADFSPILEKIALLQPDVIYLPGYARESSLFIRQARKMGIESVFLGGDAWDDIVNLVGRDIEGSYHTAAWHPMVQNKRSSGMQNLYRDIFGESIDSFNSPLAYDAVMVLAAALEKCQCTDREKVRDALYEINQFQGATGPITFDDNGDPINKRVFIVGFRDSQPVLVKAIQP